MTLLEALYVIAPCLVACYAMGLMHGAGFLTMKDSTSARTYPTAGHSALRGAAIPDPGKAQDRMGSRAGIDPSETS